LLFGGRQNPFHIDDDHIDEKPSGNQHGGNGKSTVCRVEILINTSGNLT